MTTITSPGNHPHQILRVLHLYLMLSIVKAMISLHTPQFLFDDADELLSAAEFELLHVAEDTDTHLVCNNARLSITHYLIGYLLQHNVRIKSPASIASLQQQCQVLDPRFVILDLDNITCRYDTPGKNFCALLDRVTSCYQAAIQLRSIIREPAMV